MERSWNAEWMNVNFILSDDKLTGCSLAFEAEIKKLTKYHGVTALDNIVISDEIGHNQKADGTYQCSFEDDCTADWISDKTSSSSSASPAVIDEWQLAQPSSDYFARGYYLGDHTSYNEFGHVMKFEGEFEQAGCRSATLRSAFTVKNLLTNPVQCLSMSIKSNMTSAILGEQIFTTAQILIHLVDKDTQQNVATVWHGSLIRGYSLQGWARLQAMLDLTRWAEQARNAASQGPELQIGIESVVCAVLENTTASILLDDITLSSTSCRGELDENFESAVGSREELMQLYLGYDWSTFIRVPANHSMSFVNPPTDHTFGGKINGMVLVSEQTEFPTDFVNPMISTMYYDLSSFGSAMCLNFWIWTENDTNIPEKMLMISALAKDIDFQGGLKVAAYYINFTESYDATWQLVTLPIPLDHNVEISVFLIKPFLANEQLILEFF